MSNSPGSPDPVPAPLRSDWRLHAIVFATSAVFIWTMIIHTDWIDHYAILFLAQRISAGQVPYRDFFMHFVPAPAYFVCAWFKLFGDSAQSARILLAVCGAFATACAYDISKNTIKTPLLWAGPVGVLSAFIVGNEGIGHMTFSIPAALAATALGIRAERNGKWPTALAAGAFVGIAAFCTQTVGAFMGIALFAALLLNPSAPMRSRLKQTAFLCLGTVLIALPIFGAVIASGAWPAFKYDLFEWAVERYLPFHAGVGWGAWLPPWSMLSQIPWCWQAVVISALAITWGAVWVLPLVPLYSLIRSAFARSLSGRGVLIFTSAAMILSAYPHAGAMRVVRLSGAIWVLVALEMELFIVRAYKSEISASARKPALIASLAICIVLLLGSGLQQSYRHNMTQIQTAKGAVLVYRDTRLEFEMLTRHYKPGATVLAWPEGTGAEYYFGLANPIRNDYSLLPALFTPEQLDAATADLAAQNYPPIVILPHSYANVDQVVATFKPAKHLDEFETDHFKQFINERYTIGFRDGPAIGLVRK